MRWAVALALTAALPAAAHDGVVHETPAEAAAHAAQAARETPPVPFPVDIEARFDLRDTAGRRVTEADFAGRPFLLFFGYANCEAICSTALPRMAEALDLMGEASRDLAAVMITVDPARDTGPALARALARHHPRLIGLTGDPAALAEARAAFQIEAAEASRTADGPVYAHGSFIYLVGREGRVLSILPPVLSAGRIASIVAARMSPSQPAPG